MMNEMENKALEMEELDQVNGGFPLVLLVPILIVGMKVLAEIADSCDDKKKKR